MGYARQILDTYPSTLHTDGNLLAAAIDAVSDCAQACQADTDADLSEQNLAEMVTCIRLCLNCTDVCAATGAVLSRPAGYDPAVTRPLLADLGHGGDHSGVELAGWLRPGRGDPDPARCLPVQQRGGHL
jgi:ferredoxin